MIEELSQGEFLTKAVVTPKVWRADFEGKPIIEFHDGALKLLSEMTGPVEEFFVKVMVMDKDEKLKMNRLALLKTLENMYLEFADFSKIVK